MAAAPCLLLGDGITDDTLLNIARFLPTARDLLCLMLSNKRFGIKCIAAPGVGSGGEGAAAAPEMLSLVEEAGRLWVAGCSEQERGWVPRRELESWLCLMREVGLLRVPLVFGRAHADASLSEGGAVATMNEAGPTMLSNFRSAAIKVVMWSGRHYAQFTVMSGDNMLFGVIRPGSDLEGGMEEAYNDEDEGSMLGGGGGAANQGGHCFYWTGTGQCYPGNRGWKGQQPARQHGDRIGMLLDLDQGSMTVWKNDEKLGVMQAEGLSGQEWSALLGDANFCRLFKLAHRCRAGAGVADGGGAGGGKGMGAPKPAGVAANGDRRRVRGNGTSMGGPGSSIAN